MLARFSAVVSVALLVSQAPSSVDAHGELVLPKPTYAQWGGNVAATIAPAKLPFEWAQNFTNAFDTAFLKQGLSLKEFILKNQDMSGASVAGSTPECGYSDPNGTPQPLPDAINFNNGFIHQGPCEAYCDDVLVIPHTPDCRSAHPGGIVPYDKAKCAGKNRFTFYWLTMDGGLSAPWQVYTNCVPLAGGSSSGSAPAATTAKPAATTAKPAATTATPAATTAKPDETAAPDATPATTTAPKTTAPMTSKPAVTTTKPAANCARNRKRRN